MSIKFIKYNMKSVLKRIWLKRWKILEFFALLFSILGVGFISGIAEPIYNNIPCVSRGQLEEKLESVRPTQSYEYIKDMLDVAKVSEEFVFLKEDGSKETGTRRIWSNEYYILVGYFKSDDSLFGYIVINQDEKFNPKIGTDYYGSKGFGNLMETNFVDAHTASQCYIDTVRACHTENVLGSSYYMELYDFGRSDFCYGLAITNLGTRYYEQMKEKAYSLYELPYFKIGETTNVERPETNEVYFPFRKMKPNAMIMFDNRSQINLTAFFDDITNYQFAISYSDLRRLY